MIYFLYGADSYRSRTKLREIVAAYREKNEGVFDLHRLDAGTDGPASLSEIAKAQSLFLKKKLVVIERPSEGGEPFSEELKAFLEYAKNDSNVFAVIWDYKDGKTLADVRKVIEPAASKSVEYASMSRAEAGRWLTGFLAEKKTMLKEKDFNALLDAYGGDTWWLANEAEKISLGGLMAAPPPADVGRDFSLTDAFLVDARSAIASLQRFRRSGVNEFMTFGSITSHLRTLLLVADGETAKMHPFVAQKAKQKLRFLGVERIKKVYAQLFEEDRKIKIGLSDPYSSLTSIILANQVIAA